jgi:hypothetical protein
MGIVANVGFDQFPKQGDWVGKRVEVCFHYDSSKTIGGTIVREDEEEPGLMIFRLDDGRHVLASECMYQMPKE